MTFITGWLVTYALVQVDADAHVERLVAIVALLAAAIVGAVIVSAIFLDPITRISFPLTFIFQRVSFTVICRNRTPIGAGIRPFLSGLYNIAYII